MYRLIIPNVGSRISGKLVLCPNRRPYRRSVITNIIEKSVSQSDFYRRGFVRKLDEEVDAKIIPLQPGNDAVALPTSPRTSAKALRRGQEGTVSLAPCTDCMHGMFTESAYFDSAMSTTEQLGR